MLQKLENIIVPGMTLDISLTCTGQDEYAASVRIHSEDEETSPLSISGTLEEIEENLPAVLEARKEGIKKKFFKVSAEAFDESLVEKPVAAKTAAKPSKAKAEAPAKKTDVKVEGDAALEGVLDQLYDDIENVKVEGDLNKILAKLQDLSKKHPKNVRIANMIQSAKEKLLDWDDGPTAETEEANDPESSDDDKVEPKAEVGDEPYDPFG